MFWICCILKNGNCSENLKKLDKIPEVNLLILTTNYLHQFLWSFIYFSLWCRRQKLSFFSFCSLFNHQFGGLNLGVSMKNVFPISLSCSHQTLYRKKKEIEERYGNRKFESIDQATFVPSRYFHLTSCNLHCHRAVHVCSRRNIKHI